jgi:Spy/CpxP family protein refolding chaperone
MRPRVLAAAALLAAVVASAPAIAQRTNGFRGFGGGIGGGLGGGFGGGVNGLLQIEEVRKELKLTEEQWAQVQKIMEEARAARDQDGGLNFRSLQDDPEAEREKKFVEFREKAEKRSQETQAKVKEVLLPKQVERLQQLALQRQGARALASEDVQGKLGFSDDQKKKIASIQQSQFERMRIAFRRGPNQEGNVEETRAQARKAEADMLAVLTDEQKKKLEEMKGEPFEFPQLRLGPGGQDRRPGEGDRSQNQ